MSTLRKNRATVNKNIQSVSIIVTALHLCNVIFDIQDDLSNDVNDISIATCPYQERIQRVFLYIVISAETYSKQKVT